MLLYLTTCIILLNAVVVRPFLLRESYNLELKDDAVDRIDESVNDDYGMMDHSQTGLRDTDDTKNQYRFQMTRSTNYYQTAGFLKKANIP